MFHTRKTRRRYNRVKSQNTQSKACPFCDYDTAKYVYETKHTYVVPNIVPYDLWELRDVVEHLLLMPKKHVASLKDLSKDAKIEIIDTLADYEAKGYNVYARSVDSISRSVMHQHTHLIKTKKKAAKANLVLQKPYINIKF